MYDPNKQMATKSEFEERVLEDAFHELDEVISSLQQHFVDGAWACFGRVLSRHGVDDENLARDLMRAAMKQWQPQFLSKEELDARRVRASDMEGSEFDKKRIDRDGENISFSIRAIKGGGPCRWSFRTDGEWNALELRQLLASMAAYYDARMKDEDETVD